MTTIKTFSALRDTYPWFFGADHKPTLETQAYGDSYATVAGEVFTAEGCVECHLTLGTKSFDLISHKLSFTVPTSLFSQFLEDYRAEIGA